MSAHLIITDKWLQRIRDLVPHVGVANVKASKHHGLQFFDSTQEFNFTFESIPNEHVNKYQVGWINESYILPSLKELIISD